MSRQHIYSISSALPAFHCCSEDFLQRLPWLPLPYELTPSCAASLSFLSPPQSASRRPLSCHSSRRTSFHFCRGSSPGPSSTPSAARWISSPHSLAPPLPPMAACSGKVRAFTRTPLGWSSTTRAAVNSVEELSTSRSDSYIRVYSSSFSFPSIPCLCCAIAEFFLMVGNSDIGLTRSVGATCDPVRMKSWSGN